MSALFDNLAYACFQCSRCKGPNPASLDPETGLVTPLYNPRVDPRDHHLRLSGAVIDPLTPIGRAAVFVPRPNDTARVAIRANLRARLPSG